LQVSTLTLCEFTGRDLPLEYNGCEYHFFVKANQDIAKGGGKTKAPMAIKVGPGAVAKAMAAAASSVEAEIGVAVAKAVNSANVDLEVADVLEQKVRQQYATMLEEKVASVAKDAAENLTVHGPSHKDGTDHSGGKYDTPKKTKESATAIFTAESHQTATRVGKAAKVHGREEESADSRHSGARRTDARSSPSPAQQEGGGNDDGSEDLGDL
jgi:hypothetical protein